MTERTWRQLALALLLAIASTGAGRIEPVEVEPGTKPPVMRNIILLRHAEKKAGVEDPGLTAAGRARAAFIAHHWGDPALGIRAVWSSDYRRTRETAQALAERLGLEINVYDAGDLPALAAQLREEGVNAAVIGHSNTTPQLASLLCDCEIPPISEADYETGYQVINAEDHHACAKVDFRKLWTDRPSLAD